MIQKKVQIKLYFMTLNEVVQQCGLYVTEAENNIHISTCTGLIIKENRKYINVSHINVLFL